MDLTDRKLLNLIHVTFPLAELPYLKLGQEWDIGEDKFIGRLTKLKQQNVMR